MVALDDQLMDPEKDGSTPPRNSDNTNANSDVAKGASGKDGDVDESFGVTLDSGYAWVIVAMAFFVSVFCDGSTYSFGVFLPRYIEAFQSDSATVSWVGSIASGLGSALGGIAGYLVDRYGNQRIMFIGTLLVSFGFFMASFSTELWHLFLTQGLICGVGYGLAYTGGVSVVGQWFRLRRGLALGIAVSGSGLGQFIMVNVTSSLLLNEGWRATLQYLALIEIVGLLLCTAVTKRVTPLIPATGPSMLDTAKEMFRDRRFAFLYFGYVVAIFGYVMPFVHLPTYCLLHGLSTGQANLLLSIIGLSSATGRISVGFAADRFGKLFMLRLSMVAAGTITLLWLLFTNFALLLLYSLLFGFFAGGFVALIPSVAAELFGVERLGSVLGLLYTSLAFGFFISAPIAGLLFQLQQSYTIPIVVSGVCMLLGAVLIDLMSDTNSVIHLEAMYIHHLHDQAQHLHIFQQQQLYEAHVSGKLDNNNNNNKESSKSGAVVVVPKTPTQHVSLLKELMNPIHCCFILPLFGSNNNNNKSGSEASSSKKVASLESQEYRNAAATDEETGTNNNNNNMEDKNTQDNNNNNNNKTGVEGNN